MDKAELLPLRDFINNKLKMLQDKLKDLSKLKKETEAAGVKSKYLKYFYCFYFLYFYIAEPINYESSYSRIFEVAPHVLIETTQKFLLKYLSFLQN